MDYIKCDNCAKIINIWDVYAQHDSWLSFCKECYQKGNIQDDGYMTYQIYITPDIPDEEEEFEIELDDFGWPFMTEEEIQAMEEGEG